MIRRTPLARKEKAKKPHRVPWIKKAPRPDNSRMTCCAEAKQRAGRLVLMGCIACGRVPAQIHHLRDGHGLSERAPWWETIPLCNEHHNGSQTSTHGALRREFHHAHGSERQLLERVNERLPEELRGPREVDP